MNIDNPNKSYVMVTSVDKVSLPKWNDGYMIKINRIHGQVYSIDVYKFPARYLQSLNNDEDSDEECPSCFKCNIQ